MSDDRSIDHAVSPADTEITALERQVATARGKLPLQHDTALYDALSDAEIRAERELAEWIRAQRRKQRRRAVVDELAADRRDRRTGTQIRRTDEADARWHRKALAARRRVSSPDARLAQLYRRAEWSSRALIGVVVLGMLWAGVNVQRNLVPSGDMSDPLYWLSYGIEAMISIPIIIIMITATTAARWGRELERGKVIVFEVALLGTTVALNAGPHLASGSYGRAAEYAIAPVMVGVVIWLHAWVAARYAMLIEAASVELPVDAVNYSPAERVPSAETALEPGSATAKQQVVSDTSPIEQFATNSVAVEQVPSSTHRVSAESQRTPAPSAGDHDFAAPVETHERAVVVPAAQTAQRDTETQPAPLARHHVAYRAEQRPPTEKSIAPGTLELIHKAAADHRRSGAEHSTTRTNGVTPPLRRIPVTAGAQSTTGDATGTDPVPEATAHADTVARDPNGDTAAPEAAAPTPPPPAEPEQLTLTTEPEPTEQPMRPAASAVTNGPPTADTDRKPVDNPVRLPTERDLIDRQMPETIEVDRGTGTPASTDPELVDDLDPPDDLDTPADDLDYDDTEVRALARQIARRSPLRLTLDQIEEILELTDQSWSAPSIGAEVGVSGNTVTNIVEFARKIRHPYAFTG